MAVTTSKYRNEIANLFIEDFSSNDYYLFASSVDALETLDNNSEFSKRQFLEKTIFGKKITDVEVYPVIRINQWQPGTVYSQFDDRADLSNSNFYIVLYPQDQSASDYRVFKCLYNNYSAPSTQAPNYGQFIPDQIYRTNEDGYTWKFMFSLTSEDFNRYNALGYLPIKNYTSTSSSDKGIDQIFIENNITNDGYTSITGRVSFKEIPDFVSGIYKITLESAGLNELERYYNGQWIRFERPSGISRLFEINLYEYDAINATGIVTIIDYDDENADGISVNDSFEILPRIEIRGDGNGALAYPYIENGQIVNITMHKNGSGYTNAIASVVDPLYDFNPDIADTVDERAIIRPIISPDGGHGSNPVVELLSRHVLVYTGLNFVDNTFLPTSNTYTRVGLVKNPQFYGDSPTRIDNRIRLNLDINPLSVGDIATQLDVDNIITFESIVHQVSNNTVYLTDYNGPFQNTGNTSVSFDEEKFLTTPQNQTLTINTYVIPDYIQKTGEVLYMDSFTAIERTSESNEQFKIILEF